MSGQAGEARAEAAADAEVAGEQTGGSAELDGADLVREIARLIDEKQGEDQIALEVRGLVSYTDYLLICTARNDRLAKAIHDEVHDELKHEQGLLPTITEGLPQASWILLDYPGVVVHIFIPETRDRYRLEQLWGEAPRLELGVESELDAD